MYQYKYAMSAYVLLPIIHVAYSVVDNFYSFWLGFFLKFRVTFDNKTFQKINQSVIIQEEENKHNELHNTSTWQQTCHRRCNTNRDNPTKNSAKLRVKKHQVQKKPALKVVI